MKIKTTIKNNSSREIPEELTEIDLLVDFERFNSVAAEYNLKVIELENVYEDTEIGHILIEKNITIGDT